MTWTRRPVNSEPIVVADALGFAEILGARRERIRADHPKNWCVSACAGRSAHVPQHFARIRWKYLAPGLNAQGDLPSGDFQCDFSVRAVTAVGGGSLVGPQRRAKSGQRVQSVDQRLDNRLFRWDRSRHWGNLLARK